MQNELEYEAISLGQQIIEEAKTRQFDVNISTPPFPGSFTPFRALGHLPSESYPHFNDVDDYKEADQGNPLIINKNTARASYQIEVDVYYVDESNIDQLVNIETFHKKMTVTVKSDYISNPVVLSHVFSFVDQT